MTVQSTLAGVLIVSTAYAQPIPSDSNDAVPGPPGAARPAPSAPEVERWGGGVRVTGLSGIGALPGVNYGAEVAGHLRRDEMFVELALGHWRPEETYLVATTSAKPVELALDVWTLRGGWASMQMPIRGWVLVEGGEVADARAMAGVVGRMVMGDTPAQRRWRAAGAGLGVAWPMTDAARLVGTLEVAIPLVRDRLMLESGEAHRPDWLSARYTVGLELGWR